jgi:hypothetical protein
VLRELAHTSEVLVFERGGFMTVTVFVDGSMKRAHAEDKIDFGYVDTGFGGGMVDSLLLLATFSPCAVVVERWIVVVKVVLVSIRVENATLVLSVVVVFLLTVLVVVVLRSNL